MTSPLLSISGLTVRAGSPPRARLRDIDLSIAPGELVGLVGESGSGKTILLRTVLGISPVRHGAVEGRVRYTARSGGVVDSAADALGRGGLPPGLERGWASYVFQHPMEALDPLRRVGAQLLAAVAVGDGSRGDEARRRAIRWLEAVRLPDPERVLDRHPHELSGGMAQRITIALALATRPVLLVADEPTTGLDWSVRRGVVELIAQLCRDEGMALVLVAHDLAVIRHLCERVLVLYQGVLVEDAARGSIFEPGPGRHPYTRLLQESVARIEQGRHEGIEAAAPTQQDSEGGCPFLARCPLALPPAAWATRCRDILPRFTTVAAAHRVRCHAERPA